LKQSVISENLTFFGSVLGLKRKPLFSFSRKAKIRENFRKTENFRETFGENMKMKIFVSTLFGMMQSALKWSHHA
jgi:hypothetical protein